MLAAIVIHSAGLGYNQSSEEIPMSLDSIAIPAYTLADFEARLQATP
jgi:hypothetical protein